MKLSLQYLLFVGLAVGVYLFSKNGYVNLPVTKVGKNLEVIRTRESIPRRDIIYD